MRPDWRDTFADLLAAARREAASLVEDLRLRTELPDLVETSQVLQAKRGCRR